MKVLLHSDNLRMIEKSGVGRAIVHQKSALEKNHILYTTDKNDDYDIVHINTVFLKSYQLSKSAKRQGKKVVYHAHSTKEDFLNSFSFSNLIAPLYKRWLTICYNSADVIFTPTDYSKGLLESYGLEKPIISISNGIDLESFKRSKEGRRGFREKYNINEDEKVIIAVGLYIERKGILDFVEMAKAMPEYKFIWFGYTNLNTVPQKIRKAVKTKLDNLIFAGYIPREELIDAYSGSDLFIFPTHEETEGIVLLEALAMKIPILIRDIPIYQGWLKDSENIYKAKTIEEFCKKAKDILEGNIPSLVEEGYEVAKERNIESVGKVLVSEYKKLLGNRYVIVGEEITEG